MEKLTLMEILQGSSTVLFALAMFILNGFKQSINEVKQSISDLNVNIAKLIISNDNTDERSRSNTKEIDKLRERVHKLEGHSFRFQDFLKDQ